MGETPSLPPPDALTFGERLHALREAAGLSQEELAARASLSTDAISSLERGTRTHPYPATVRALADALDLDPQRRAELVTTLPRRHRARRHAAPTTTPGSLDLPPAATALHGRDGDIGAVCDLLGSPATRLVTLTGPGGIGKSRLAVAVAQRVSGDIRDGVAFVGLASVPDETLVLPEIGRALRVDAERTGSDDAVLDTLLPLELLLLLDNLEHLPGAAAVVSRLLTSCPGLKVLATSRASLRVRGEFEYDVSPLALPDLEVRDPAALVASPAALLLIERGRAVRRELAVHPQDVPALAAICHRLAGLPLALELAAAGLRVLDPVGLLARLDDVLATPASADLPARQRSMRATLDWSYGLLTEQDKAVFRLASVFVGGFTLEAAEAVVNDEDMLGAVERLTAQSLWTATSSASGALRHGMLEPVAQYARSLLAEDEEAAARWAHAEFFLAQAEQAEQALQWDGQQVRALHLFDTDEGNFWAALEWSISSRRGDIAGRLTWALFIFWWVRGRRQRGRRIANQVLELELTEVLRARALHVAAALPEPGKEPARTIEDTYLQSVELAQRAGDFATAAASATGAGLIALGGGDLVTAEHRLRGAFRRRSEQVLGRMECRAGSQLVGGGAEAFGDADGAVEHAAQALALTGRRADLLSQSIGLYNPGQAELALGQRTARRGNTWSKRPGCASRRGTPATCHISSTRSPRPSSRRERGTRGHAARRGRGAAGGRRVDVYSWYADDFERREPDASQVPQRSVKLGSNVRFDAGRSWPGRRGRTRQGEGPPPPGDCQGRVSDQCRGSGGVVRRAHRYRSEGSSSQPRRGGS